MSKDRIRKQLIQRRKAPTQEQRKESSEKIMQKLLSQPEYKKAKSVMFYLSLEDEVQTGEMIKDALSQKKDVLIPRTDTRKKAIAAVQISEKTKFKQNGELKVMEPEEGRIVDKKSIDVVIIPAVGFDFWGRRIGYGGGYYDRFLQGTSAKKIGLAYDFQIINEIPSEDHDVKTDMVITEKRVIRYTNGSD